ncbi:pseudouridine kinase [Aquincola sp. S2]|uniref:Pseudouridine kinase n=1 Tax=Pseudaquabacterium terrae TaxID=2732868 RepID=A0ABX2ELR4_9BURK|nr:PfkB family carbohydrate kinase [Aquabacterium terrae]NRF69459.1 pseudouridine kinase [Aquabacterium terrae]
MRIQRVVVIGGANLDLAGHADEPARPGDSSPGRVHAAAGGVGRNIAENLARLGRRVRLVSALGDDADGRWLRRVTAAAGVDTGGCQVITDARTARYLSLHAADGRLLQAVNDMAVLDALGPARLATESNRLRRAAAIVLDANLRDTALAWLFEQRFEVPLHADAVSAAKCLRLKPGLAQLHTLKLNRLEAETLSGLPARTPHQAARVADWFHAQGVRRLALSLGRDGLRLSDRDGPHCERPAWPVPLRNVTGAGDALMAGLVHAQLGGWPLPRAADFALGCAALTLTVDASNHPAISERAVLALRRRCRVAPSIDNPS